MEKKQWTIRILAGAGLFVAGFLVRLVWDGYADKQAAIAAAAEAEVAMEERKALESKLAALEAVMGGYLEADEIQVRIEDGQVQWYDGRLWHEVASVKEMEQEDKFYAAGESFQAFDEQLRQEKAALRQEQAAGEEASREPSAGMKEVPKAPSRPKVTAPQEPVATPEPEVQPETPPASSGGSAPVYQPPASSGGGGSSDTGGDGENMEWSDDYL